MAQSYLIFAQGRRIEITQHAANETVLLADSVKESIEGKLKKQFPIYLEQVESGNIGKLEVQTPDANEAFETLKNCYDKFIVAAGGLVKNDQGELLLIYRNGKWDLPKGKLEKGEDAATGALREVQEETGLQKLKLLSEFQRTYHTYTEKDNRILKETVWYLMHGHNEHLAPQTEEGITHVEWVGKQDAAKVYANTYDNILLLIKAFFKA